MHDRAVAVFARVPRKGQVKRRLAEELGDLEALRIYTDLLNSALKRFAALSCPVWLYADAAGLDDLAARHGMQLKLQAGADLGQRMAGALHDLLRTSRAAALVGVDIPLLDAEFVESAFGKLGRADLVLGPTEDGGYCLIALQKMHEALFQDVPWGSSEVLATTLSRAASLGLEVALAETLWDVDRAEDVRRMLHK